MKFLQALLVVASLVLPASAQTIYLNTLASFNGTNGAATRAGLVQGTNGNFYGVAYQGGSNNLGCVFEILPGGTISNLYSFPGGTNSAYPRSTLLLGRDGYFYGEMVGGGVTFGSLGYIFRMSHAGVLTDFADFNGFDGESPSGGLMQGQDGNFYGTCQEAGGAGPNFYGSIFRVTPDGAISNLFSFAGTTNGSMPLGGLVQATNGVLYGTTAQGGTNGNYGTIFMITTNGAFTSLFSFNKTNGATPYATMVVGPDGNLYGTTEGGGPGVESLGTIFKITPSGNFTLLHSFTGDDGGAVYGGLVVGTNGILYGTTDGGGDDYSGAIYQITTNGDFTLLYSFDYDDSFNYPAGENPEDSLVQGTDGNFYGTTSLGGAYNEGTIFEFSLTPPVATGPAFTSIGQTNGLVAFTWSAVSNAVYQVQYLTDLTQTNWTNLGGPITATNTEVSGSDVLGPDDQRFYRVVLMP